jgi:putative transcriptional regulator
VQEEKMSKRAFDKIADGLKDAIAIAEGRAKAGTYRVHVPERIDVKALRRRLKMTQEEFALRFNLSVARLRDWEQGRSEPDGAVRPYLKVIEREPKAVARALSA